MSSVGPMDNLQSHSTDHIVSSLSYPYAFDEPEHYLESPCTSASTSPVDSSYDLQYAAYHHSEHLHPSSDPNSAESQQDTPKATTKRKRENRYKNAPPSVLSRRRAQNRASQRAYRERKDQRIKDLELLLDEAKQKNDVLGHAYATLEAEYVKLKSQQDITSQYQSEALAYNISGSHSDPAMNLYMFPDTGEYVNGTVTNNWS
ncbi:hypothetical protein Micbo1qcDRAFT_195841 [Microdochium bolleyi]|uniref:Putative transcription factor kapC n=1 Tax=Microdochium bolleyi TaxID=196109 RepID=A0A136J1R9_9PEZI|nr:hypothetical protein Micbo1qcDRAFT_195841 [Microdochium bolleyi]